MRKEFELTDEQLQKLLDASRSVPYLVVGGTSPSSPQENANHAWSILGDEMGFDSMTVEPVRSKGNKFFTAIEK